MWFDQEREELEIEFNARYDYIAELRKEHEESPETLASEAEWYAEMAQTEWDAFIGPRLPRDRIVRQDGSVVVLIDDEIPF